MATQSNIAIKVNSVKKTFKLPHEKHSSIKGLVLSASKRRKGFEVQKTLDGVSFEIEKGDFFGIVGRNGSGKSTLLKILSSIYEPSSGSVEVNGALTPFIELGVGFNPELTGRENIFMNGALLGFSRKQIALIYDDIVGFAELERFMDQKLKNYSSGMQVRLAFSIAIHSDSDIYLFDEVLAVGDYSFQQKCLEYFKYLKSIGKTVVLVSHDSNALQMFCNKGILIEGGKIVKQGNIREVLAAYAKINADSTAPPAPGLSPGSRMKLEGGNSVSLEALIIEKDGKKAAAFGPNEEIQISIRLKPLIDIESPVFGIVFQDASGQPIFATNTLDAKIKTKDIKKGNIARFKFKIPNLFNDGTYYVSGAIASKDRSSTYLRYLNAGQFKSIGWENTAKGMVYFPYDFTQD